METFKKIFLGVVGVIIGGFTIYLGYFGFFKGLNNDHNDYFVGLCTLFTGILAITGVCFTIFNSQRIKNKELLNELDQKSEWRKELMDIASKINISTKDIYRILASLRFIPKGEIEIYDIRINNIFTNDIEVYNFLKRHKDKDFYIISNYIYNDLIEILKNYYKDENKNRSFCEKQLTAKESQKVRLYTLFLLKHHWEYNQSEEKKNKFINIERQEFEKVRKQVKQLDNGFESFYIKGYENFKSEEEKFEDFEIPINSANKDLKHCIKEQKKNKEELIVRNLTLDKKGCKTILKGQYKSNK